MYSKVKLRYGDETVFKNPEMNNLDGLTYLFFNMNGPSEVSSYAQSGYFDVAVGTNNKVSIDRTEFKFYYGHSNDLFANLTFEFVDEKEIDITGGTKMAEKIWIIGG